MSSIQNFTASLSEGASKLSGMLSSGCSTAYSGLGTGVSKLSSGARTGVSKLSSGARTGVSKLSSGTRTVLSGLSNRVGSLSKTTLASYAALQSKNPVAANLIIPAIAIVVTYVVTRTFFPKQVPGPTQFRTPADVTAELEKLRPLESRVSALQRKLDRFSGEDGSATILRRQLNTVILEKGELEAQIAGLTGPEGIVAKLRQELKEQEEKFLELDEEVTNWKR